MFFRLQLFSLNIASVILLVFFLCLGSQNLNKRYSLDFIIDKTVELPLGFLIGSSFSLGIFAGGITSILMINNQTNEKD